MHWYTNFLKGSNFFKGSEKKSDLISGKEFLRHCQPKKQEICPRLSHPCQNEAFY
jgi:hypothetical protein